jgi:hypothetical protein
MRSRALVAAAAIVFVAACGARTTLQSATGTADGAGGAGTGSTTSTVASTTSTGVNSGPGGGPSLACGALVGHDPPIELPGSNLALSARHPSLQLLGNGDVLALARRDAPNSPAVGSVNITATRFDPWSGWPPALDPAVEVTPSAPAFGFVSSVEPTGTFALGFKPFPANAPAGCQLQASYGIAPGAPLGPGALSAHENGSCSDSPVSVATAGDGSHFVASDILVSDKNGAAVRGMSIEVLDPKGNLITSANDACATNLFVGDVLATDSGFLFVQSAADTLDCSTSGPARRLFLRKFDGGAQEDLDVYDGFDDLVFARILPRKGGSWIFFRESGASAEVQPPAMAIPFGTDSADGQQFAITDPGAGQVAIAAFRGGFVVATVDSLDPTAPTVLLRVYSAEGSLTTQSSFSTDDAWLGQDRLAIIASPDSKSLLVGWTGASPGGPDRLIVRRFDCADVK